MKNENKLTRVLFLIATHLMVAAIAGGITFWTLQQQMNRQTDPGMQKLQQVQQIIDQCYIGQAEAEEVIDGAAIGMVSAIDDRWSHYVSKEDMQEYLQQKKNVHYGIGITILQREEYEGFLVINVSPVSSAKDVGILPGDVLTHVEGQSVLELGITGTADLIKGEEGTVVEITVQREGQALTFYPTLGDVVDEVVSGQMLENQIGYIRIFNFNDRCCQETVALIEELMEQGAQKLIFDVRFNPGGYKHELVELLDYLLPAGDLFHSVHYDGTTYTDPSDKNCLPMPMAVLFNSDSYSAAEFFAAALDEYDWAVTVGEASVGKSRYQSTFTLMDGSGLNLSVGSYLTPKGVDLAEQGGLQPNIPVAVEEDLKWKIDARLLPLEEDPQVQAAVKYLLENS